MTEAVRNRGTGGDTGATAAAAPAAAKPAPAAVQSKYALIIKSALQLPVLVFSVVFGLYIGLRDDTWTWFDYHPLFMITAWCALVCNAVLLKKVKGADNLRWHAYSMIWAMFFTVGGFYVIYTNKNMMNKEHFTTPHGQFGVFMVVNMVIGALGSFIALDFDNGIAKGNLLIRFLHKYYFRFTIACGWYMVYEGLNKVGLDQVYINIYSACALIMVPVLLIFPL